MLARDTGVQTMQRFAGKTLKGFAIVEKGIENPSLVIWPTQEQAERELVEVEAHAWPEKKEFEIVQVV